MIAFPRKTVLNVSRHAEIGRRFNNLDAGDRMGGYGWNAYNCAWNDDDSDHERVVRARGRFNRAAAYGFRKLDRLTGDLHGLYRNAGSITALPVYRQADLLHFHVVHEHFLSFADMRSLAADKPVVWTWHDPYMLTGHCVHPFGCKGFETGCQTCPHLDYYPPIMIDRAKVNLQEKLAAVRDIDPLVVVASDYMREMIARSLYKDSVRVKTIPFGIEFGQPRDFAEARARLGIKEGNIVIGFRADPSVFKGLPLILQALRNILQTHESLPLSIVTFHKKGLCDDMKEKIQVVDAGWIEDSAIYDYYSAMDFFLMPSKAEAFGMMAVEAMSVGVLPIVTHGTALPSVVRAPTYGIAVDHTAEALRDAVLSCIADVETYRQTRAERSAFARRTYGIDTFCKRLAAAYEEEADYRLQHKRNLT